MASPNKRGERKDPAFLFYATTWLQSAETNSMTLEQQGAYLRLLCFAWLHGNIPADREEIRALLGLALAPQEVFERVWSGRLPRCWVEMPGTPGRLINERQEHERQERRQKSEEMRERGQAGGKQSAEQRASAAASRQQAGGQAADEAEGQADGQAKPKPSTTTSTSPDREPDSTASSVPERGGVPPSYGEERARSAASLVAGAASSRRVRA